MPILTSLPSKCASACRPQARHARCARTARLSVRAAAVAPDTSGLSASTPYDRVFNFSAGPACLPVDVLEQVRDDLLNYKGSGMSVMEMSHRGKTFFGIYEKAVADLRTLLGVPDNFKILMLQGGASTQFSAVPLNLTAAGETIDHVITGSWSKKATAEAKKYCNVNVAAQGDNKSIPDASDWRLSPDSRFVHYCDNETIQGVEFKSVPDVGDRLLIADMSSDFCSKPIDFTRYGVIYAGAQKNIGPSGVTIVIVRDDLIGNARPETPTMLDYKTHAENDSMYNTPPCWGIYLCGLVFDKLLREGGIEKMQARNVEKATLLYEAIEQSEGFFCSPVDPSVRSMMNVPFTIPSKPELEAVFIKDAAELGLVTLKGHRSVGGMRASIYNSMPPKGCEKLAEFMKTFAASH